MQEWTADENNLNADGKYLNFAKAMAVCAVEEAAGAAGAVTYSLTGTDPSDSPIELAFDPATRRLTGTAPAAAGVPDAGLQRADLTVTTTGECPEDTPAPPPEPSAAPEPATTTTVPDPTAAPGPTTTVPAPELVAAPEIEREGGVAGWVIALPVIAALLAVVGGVAYVRRRRRR